MPAVDSGKSGSRQQWSVRAFLASDAGKLVLILLAGLLLRLALSPFGGFWGDLQVFRFWVARFASEPVWQFYEAPRFVSHLPGDLWLFWVLAQLSLILAPGASLMALPTPVLKLIPIAADVCTAGALFLAARRLAGPPAGLAAAALFTFNPGPIFVSATWGQIDSLSAGCLVLALWLIVRGNPEWALVPLTYAVLVKPQTVLLAPLCLIAFLRGSILPHTAWGSQRCTDWQALWRAARRGLLALGCAALLALAILLPFDVGIPPLPTRWTIMERFGRAYATFPSATFNAFSVWALLPAPGPADRISDAEPLIGGLTPRIVGIGLASIAYAGILLVTWLRYSNRTLVWASVAIFFGFFILMTRMHERYLFPAVALGAVAASLSWPARWWYIGLSAVFFVNVFWFYEFYYPLTSFRHLYQSKTSMMGFTLINVALLLYFLVRGLPALKPRLKRVNLDTASPEQPVIERLDRASIQQT